MDKLETLSGQLDDLEAQVMVIKALLDNDAVTRSQVLEAKDDIAQVNGTLERIQVSMKVQQRPRIPHWIFPILFHDYLAWFNHVPLLSKSKSLLVSDASQYQ